MRRIVKEEGFLALWRGNLPGVIRYFPAQALNVALRPINKLFRYDIRKDGYMKWFIGNLMSGALAGMISMAFVYPLDTCSTLLMADVKVQLIHSFRRRRRKNNKK